MRFENTRVLVTGAGSGIGRAACLAFSKEGADLTAADVNLDSAHDSGETIVSAGGKARVIQLDVARPNAVKTAVRELGGVDILVNSAGVHEIAAFLELDFTECQRVSERDLFVQPGGSPPDDRPGAGRERCQPGLSG